MQSFHILSAAKNNIHVEIYFRDNFDNQERAAPNIKFDDEIFLINKFFVADEKKGW